MTKYNDGYDNRDNDGNKYVKYKNNDSDGSVSYGLIFDPFRMLWSCLGLAEDNWEMKDIELQPWSTMCLRIGL